jgi:signal transduction histidine kinase
MTRNEMKAQKKPMQMPSSPEVTPAFIDIARLAQHVGYTGSKSASNTVAAMLLEKLLTLCEARSGALLLTIQNPAEPGYFYISSLSGYKVSRIFALQGMDEEEALVRLASYPLEGPDLQFLSDEPCWLTCRLPISSSSYALLLLGWVCKDVNECITNVEKGRLVLPLVADVAGAVIANTLLAEHAHELEISNKHQALHEMELLKAELLATVSHELRGPLSSIKGYAATLLRHEHRIEREERHEFLLAINQASERLAVVIDRLLEMSQLDTGTITFDLAPVNLVHLVHEAITALGERVGEKLVVSIDLPRQGQQEDHSASSPNPVRTTIVVRLEGLYGMLTSEEPVIQADRFRLREVLDNLLENALNYSTEGGMIEVTLQPVVASDTVGRPQTSSDNEEYNGKETATMVRLPEHQRMIEVVVRDYGIGIPANQLERIFDRFHRVDTGLTREVNGLGLGLAICKRIVEMHKGVIWAESVPGKGSAFHVWLPVNL